mgnify:CR=1 FL=1
MDIYYLTVFSHHLHVTWCPELCTIYNNNHSIISYDFVDQEYRQGSAGRWAGHRVQDGFAHVCGTLVEMAGRLGSAGTVEPSSCLWPHQNHSLRIITVIRWQAKTPREDVPSGPDRSFKTLYCISIVAMTNYYTFSVLKQHRCILSVLEVWSPKWELRG